MLKNSLDQLIVPAPPYRMSRPTATLAVSPSIQDQLKGQEASVPKIETVPPALEKTMQGRAVELADSAEHVRNPALESEHPDLKTKGEELSGKVASLREAAGELPSRLSDTTSQKIKSPTPQEVGRAAKEVQEVITGGGKVVELPDKEGKKAFGVFPTAEGGVRIKTLGEKSATEPPLDMSVLSSDTSRENYKKDKAEGKSVAGTEKYIREQMAFRAEQARKTEELAKNTPVPSGEKGVKVGGIVKVGNTRARVLEVNAEGRHTRVDTIEKPQPETTTPPTPPVEKKPTQDQKDIDRAAGEGMNGATAPAIDSSKVVHILKNPAIERARVAGPLDGDDAARDAAQGRIAHQERFGEAPPPRVSVERPWQEKPLLDASLRQSREAHAREYKNERLGPISLLSESTRLIVEKTGMKPWLDTLVPRFKSLFPRRFAEIRMMQQSRAENKQETAALNLEVAKGKLADAGFPMRLYYANRVRKWEKRQSKWEGKVTRYHALREGWQNRHDNLQKQVISRFERELAPYRGIIDGLKTKEKAFLEASSILRQDQKQLQQAFAAAETKGSEKWFLRPSVRAAVSRAKKELSEIEKKIAASDKHLAKIRAPLARAVAGAGKWESKKKGVAGILAHPEAAGLSRGLSGRAPEPGPVQTARSATEQERMGEAWTPDEFQQAWNVRLYKPTFVNPSEFSKFVENQRAAAGKTGVTTKSDLLELAAAYFRDRTTGAGMRDFRKNVKLFLSVTKPLKPTPTP